MLSHAKSSHCALARANRVFRADEKRIRAKNTVIRKNEDSTGVLYKIADCARMAFHPAQSSIRADGFSSAQNRKWQ